MGLLDESDARELITCPLQHAGISFDTTDDQLLKRYGRHPFLLHRVLHEYSYAAQHGLSPDLRHLERSLYDVMQDLWLRCDEREVTRLFAVIAKKDIPHDKVSRDLEDRGLLDKNSLFCPAFARALPERLIPEKTTIEDYLGEIKKNPQKALNMAGRWLKYLEHIEKAATHIGKIKKAWDLVVPPEKIPAP